MDMLSYNGNTFVNSARFARLVAHVQFPALLLSILSLFFSRGCEAEAYPSGPMSQQHTYTTHFVNNKKQTNANVCTHMWKKEQRPSGGRRVL